MPLPDGFAELEPFEAGWALESEAARNAKRLATPIEEIREFYEIMLRHMDAVVARLSAYRIDALPEAEKSLYQLALSLMEVAPAVEIHDAPDVPDAIEAHRFLIRSP